ncbi:MAG: 2-oxoacid ferredoxin oxidoreductase [Elusimicrobia bacterium RIFCSPLOWO2_02_FULL_39_32]|nr:MAG: 2-oxoacid ferredoxin oxidoreductase [Elusimicrobia bacterium GWA2_38_7]OGR80619.1 MAG: 2-oxoacid ferredoxin oxidoreductase [Elusimicrobia bacterium RIFCSPHIGHO2_02_FULL_39_36]OGR91468.1 MAG: 2-oxoacid ferredoxin oxidoreductase [Elusimicrobia bacterium RIFCSPLOWO2_02_FULL_39_32]OGS00723.1 MAG: 2-oxoacid ferredoxin oxidoreductase [Elusimicrobia bacterium RIFCSPLOWO2_12_FULL_39_28]
MAETLEISKFKSKIAPDWCPGCGDFGVLSALQKACANLNVETKDVLVVSGIGCSSNLPGFFGSYGMHTLHGRAVAVAEGAKLGNPDLTVVVTGGDGDGYGIGIGHFIHAMRRNINMTYIVMNNQIYGLTTGQCSPTTELHTQTKSTPEGSIEVPINPIQLALVSGATFVARGFSGSQDLLSDLMMKAIKHKGFSIVDVFSPCVTYNKKNTYPWFRERVYNLQEDQHDTSDWNSAMKRSQEWNTRIPTGIFYQTDALTYEEQDPAFKFGAPAKQKLGLNAEDAKALVESFK